MPFFTFRNWDRTWSVTKPFLFLLAAQKWPRHETTVDQRTLVVCYRVGSHFYGICWLLLFYYFQIFSLPLCLSSCYYCTTDFNDLISYSIKEEFKFGEISIQIFWSSGNWIELRERVSRWHRCRLFRYEYDDFSLTIRNGKEYRLFLAKWKLWCVALVRPAETVLSNWIQ